MRAKERLLSKSRLCQQKKAVGGVEKVNKIGRSFSLTRFAQFVSEV